MSDAILRAAISTQAMRSMVVIRVRHHGASDLMAHAGIDH